MGKVILSQKNYTRILHHQVFLATVNQHSDINRNQWYKQIQKEILILQHNA